jgi:aspartyl/asparaginyl beta-hydroxylase (cupin superfamily)
MATRTVSTNDVPEPILSPPSSIDLRDRTLRVRPPRGPVERTVAAIQDWIEQRVAEVSVHPDLPVYDPAWFPWVAEIEAEWRLIRAELDQVMPYRDQLPSFHAVLKEVSAITTDDQWKTFFLAGIGMDCRENAKRCPETMRLLKKIPGMRTAFFSILSPHKHIPAHRGAFNGILRFHLGLIVPEPRERVRIRIANDIWHWSEGKSLVFDDSYNHEVWNDTDGHRAVLFVDFARPLRPPYHRLNDAFLDMAVVAPFLREAGTKQKRWEKSFYRQERS